MDPFPEITAERVMFREQLAAAGFSDDGTILYGFVRWHDATGRELTTRITVEPGEAFPYGPPTVKLDARYASPTDPVPTFHIETNGALCLFDRDVPVDGACWRSVPDLLTWIGGWLRHTADGWPGDTDTDLERYLECNNRFVVYDGDDLAGKTGLLELTGSPVVTRVRYKEPTPPRSRKGKRARRREARVSKPCGYLLDVDELKAPLRSWADVLDAGGPRAAKAQRLIRLGQLSVLLVRYLRGGREGMLALACRRSAVPGGIEIRCCDASDESLGARELRAGNGSGLLSRYRVAVVGCGAIGSFTADLLFRAGVRRLTLRDPQILRPGNVVRHLAGNTYIGYLKVDAVRARLAELGLPVDLVVTSTEAVATPRQASDLLSEHVLVIDATGDERATALLLWAAADNGGKLISVCLQRSGGIARVDRFPLADGEHHLPAVPALDAGEHLVRERGCGDAVSLTPRTALLQPLPSQPVLPSLS
jgi:ThiF family